MRKTTCRSLLPLLLSLGLLVSGACGGGGGGGGAAGSFEGPIIGEGDLIEPPPGWGAGFGEGAPDSASFRILDVGPSSLITVGRHAVAWTATEWATLWIEHHGVWPPGIGAPEEPPPAVDFESEIVVAIFLGTKPTTAWTLDIMSVNLIGQGLRVDYLEEERGASCGVAQMITTPYVIAAVTRVPGSITFSRLSRVADCP